MIIFDDGLSSDEFGISDIALQSFGSDTDPEVELQHYFGPKGYCPPKGCYPCPTPYGREQDCWGGSGSGSWGGSGSGSWGSNGSNGSSIGGIGGILPVGDLSECNCFQINTDIRNLKIDLSDLTDFVT